MLRRLGLLLTGCAVLHAAPWHLGAQGVYLPGGGAPGVTVQLLRPDFRFGGVDNPSFTAFLGARIPFGNSAQLVGELPFALVDDPVSGSTIGNPYLGVRLAQRGGGAWGEFGVRLPLVSDEGDGAEAAFFGVLSDFSRIEAFTPNVLTISTLAGYDLTTSNGFVFQAGGGPAAWIPTKGDGADVELVVHYLLRAGVAKGPVRVLGGFSGWAILTEEVGGVGERTIDQLTVTMDVAIGRVRPSLYLAVPIDDDYNELVGVVIGLGVTIPAGGR